MKKKKIDWFFMIFLFFALVILVVFACFVNKKLIYINKNLDITNNKNKIEEKVDKSYTIAGYGQAESLNLAISAGIIMNTIKN